MPRLAVQRCVLRPRATLLLQNIINEPSQQLPLEKKEAEEEVVYIQCVCVLKCASVCKSKKRLNGKREGDGDRIREGSGGVRWPFNLESLM